MFGPAGGAAPLAVASGRPLGTGIISPWQDSGSLAHIAYTELFGNASDVVDRNVAMRVAPIKRGRAIIVGKCADLPLNLGTWTAGRVWQPAADQPAWLTTTTGVQTAWHRMAWTLDDLIFNGWSLWAVERSAGQIVNAGRIHPARWAFDQTAPLGIKVDDQDVTDARAIILFAGPDEGMLSTADDVIRGAKAMEKSWVGRVQNPVPMTVLHEVKDQGLSATEAKAYVDAWSAARKSPDGAVGYLPAGLQMEVYGDTEADLFTEGRNNVRLDVANHLNLPASALDGSTATASLTYVTQEGDRQELIDFLEYWMAPIDARLSMDDVCPAGQVIRFDRSSLTAAPNDSHGPSTSTDPAPAVTPAPSQEAVTA